MLQFFFNYCSYGAGAYNYKTLLYGGRERKVGTFYAIEIWYGIQGDKRILLKGTVKRNGNGRN
jgi:hypothetical protein